MTMTTNTIPATTPGRGWGEWLDSQSGRFMVLPAVIVLLCFAIFPLIVSAYLSLSRFALAPGGFTLNFIGLVNYRKLLTGSQQYHLLGNLGTMGPIQWGVLALFAVGLVLLLARYLRRGGPTVLGTLGRGIAIALAF